MGNYHRWLDRLQVMERKFRPSSWYLSALMLVAFVLGALSYHSWLALDNTPISLGGGKSKQLAAQLTEQAQQLASRNLELALERDANDRLKQMFAEQHQQQKALERELAFYRAIMAPGENADGVSIHGLELLPGLQPGSQKLKLVLTQLQKRKQALKGRVEATLIGLRDNKPTELDISKAGGKFSGFEFRYFQVLESELLVPADFELKRVRVKVIVPASRWSKGAQTEQEFSLPELLEGQKEAGIILEQNSQVTDNSAQNTEVRGSND
ncbi:DUF6776 family protein [Shewanella sedimentimangrovi]|uniref:MSHA biogenesis protein MshJ n=1 Tax=Shewanella sedimentimangrovi TaxID=2814293 RepID=A0ABX7R2G8_9GAMM|nr:DUF6776 family protein [Shewanella sedimentimangrovi]QSX38012.1 hypothetical protein JYB85_04005 [Shewanella sedimentimangrovi]